MGKQQKKWENRTKGLKFAISVFFPDSRHDSKKKNVLRQSSKISIFFLQQLFVFGCFLTIKRGPFTKVTVKFPKTREINHLKTVSYVKLSVLSVFEHKKFLRVCLHRLF
jgi:hypothetical protein